LFENNENDLDILANTDIDNMLMSSELCDSFNLQDLEGIDYVA
jgi:hypothetical protein